MSGNIYVKDDLIVTNNLCSEIIKESNSFKEASFIFEKIINFEITDERTNFENTFFYSNIKVLEVELVAKGYTESEINLFFDKFQKVLFCSQTIREMVLNYKNYSNLTFQYIMNFVSVINDLNYKKNFKGCYNNLKISDSELEDLFENLILLKQLYKGFRSSYKNLINKKTKSFNIRNLEQTIENFVIEFTEGKDTEIIYEKLLLIQELFTIFKEFDKTFKNIEYIDIDDLLIKISSLIQNLEIKSDILLVVIDYYQYHKALKIISNINLLINNNKDISKEISKIEINISEKYPELKNKENYYKITSVRSIIDNFKQYVKDIRDKKATDVDYKLINSFGNLYLKIVFQEYDIRNNNNDYINFTIRKDLIYLIEFFIELSNKNNKNNEDEKMLKNIENQLFYNIDEMYKIYTNIEFSFYHNFINNNYISIKEIYDIVNIDSIINDIYFELYHYYKDKIINIIDNRYLSKISEKDFKFYYNLALCIKQNENIYKDLCLNSNLSIHIMNSCKVDSNIHKNFGYRNFFIKDNINNVFNIVTTNFFIESFIDIYNYNQEYEFIDDSSFNNPLNFLIKQTKENYPFNKYIIGYNFSLDSLILNDKKVFFSNYFHSNRNNIKLTRLGQKLKYASKFNINLIQIISLLMDYIIFKSEKPTIHSYKLSE